MYSKYLLQWPFTKLMGVQEPASAFASMLNFVVHTCMYHKIMKHCSIKTMPIVLFWHIFAVVSIELELYILTMAYKSFNMTTTAKKYISSFSTFAERNLLKNFLLSI